jgi:hypothetical protein
MLTTYIFFILISYNFYTQCSFYCIWSHGCLMSDFISHPNETIKVHTYIHYIFRGWEDVLNDEIPQDHISKYYDRYQVRCNGNHCRSSWLCIYWYCASTDTINYNWVLIFFYRLNSLVAIKAHSDIDIMIQSIIEKYFAKSKNADEE